MAKYIGSRKRQNIRKRKPEVGLFVDVNDSVRNIKGEGKITNIIAPNVIEVKMTDTGEHYRVYNNQVSANQAKDEVVNV